ALALGLQRWRGFGSGTVNTVMLLPLVTPEIVMGVALLLLFLKVFPGLGLGTSAQAIGQVTFTLSYVVVIVRGRLVSIGREYEEAAADLRAPARAHACACVDRRCRARALTRARRAPQHHPAPRSHARALLPPLPRGPRRPASCLHCSPYRPAPEHPPTTQRPPSRPRSLS